MCKTPYRVTMPNGDQQPVPCGKCPDCKATRVFGWQFRLMQELKRSTHASFVTLTYDKAHLPYLGNRASLSVSDCQLFFKRLRKRTPGQKIKYYLAGEYGGVSWRPHYHIILFNCANPYDVDKAWQMGSTHHVQDVNEATIGYTLKYINKPKRVPQYKDDPRKPEFSIMSKGIGLNYLTPQMCDWHHADLLERMYVNGSQGKKIAMPRYYKLKLYSAEQREALAESNARKAIDQTNRLIKTYGSSQAYDDALEQVILADLAKFKNNQKKEKS